MDSTKIIAFAPVVSASCAFLALLVSCYVATVFINGNRLTAKNLQLAATNLQQSRELHEQSVEASREIQRLSLEHATISKSVDIMLHTTERYIDIWTRMNKVRNDPTYNEEPARLYQRFWSLQREQFKYWQLGFIDDTEYKLIMLYRKEEWDRNTNLRNLSYRDGADASLKVIGWEPFTKFMHVVWSGHIDDAMKEMRPAA